MKQAANQQRPTKPRRSQRKLTDAEWDRIQVHYETDANKIALRPLADLYSVPRQTVMLRAAKYKWRRQDNLAVVARRALEQSTDQAMQSAIKQIAEPAIIALTQKAMTDLQPWIEKKKRTHIRSQVIRAHRALSRLDSITKGKPKLDAKNEAFIAKSVDTYDNVARRNLGMNDSSTLGGAFGSTGIQVLCNQAVVQVSQPS